MEATLFLVMLHECTMPDVLYFKQTHKSNLVPFELRLDFIIGVF